jgi:hypothetical protein
MISTTTDSANTSHAVQATTVISPIRMLPSSGRVSAATTCDQPTAAGSGLPMKITRNAGTPARPRISTTSAAIPLITRMLGPASATTCLASFPR